MVATKAVAQPSDVIQNLVLVRSEGRRALGWLAVAIASTAVAYFKVNEPNVAVLHVRDAMRQLERTVSILQDARLAAERAEEALKGLGMTTRGADRDA